MKARWVGLASVFVLGAVSVGLAITRASANRDSDGDGLSNGQERKWLLDPHRADTDGDTVVDGQDPNPRVPMTGRAAFVDALVEWLVSEEALPALMNEVESPGAAALTFTPSSESPAGSSAPPPLEEHLVLIELRPVPLFRPVAMGALPVEPSLAVSPRVITLSEREARHGGDAFGDERSIQLWLFFDPDGQRARIRVDLGGQGHELQATRVATGWAMHGLGSWVE
jgi:hypothetical protein